LPRLARAHGVVDVRDPAVDDELHRRDGDDTREARYAHRPLDEQPVALEGAAVLVHDGGARTAGQCNCKGAGMRRREERALRGRGDGGRRHERHEHHVYSTPRRGRR
jgi:hypothetical protein